MKVKLKEKFKEPWRYFCLLIAVLNLAIASARWMKERNVLIDFSENIETESEIMIMALLFPCFLHILVVFGHCIDKRARFLQMTKKQYWKAGIIQGLAVLLGLSIGCQWYAIGTVTFMFYIWILYIGKKYIVPT